VKLGLLVNPIAGIGSELAWKGTDDIDKAWNYAKELTIRPSTKIVNRIKHILKDHEVYSTSITPEIGKVVYEMNIPSSRNDTLIAAKSLINHDIELLIFVGGDGTARDLVSTVGEIPVLGIPSGVKIFSGCFVHKPEDLKKVLDNWNGTVSEVEILDLDENEYRQGITQSKLYGTVRVPKVSEIQQGKIGGGSIDDEITFEMFALRIAEQGWLNGVILVGPGSTTKKIFEHLGKKKTLLGVDIFENGQLIIEDATTQQIQTLKIDEIWITPIGNQGHIFGRGNRQITAETIAKVKKKNIKVFATPEKIDKLEVLYIDTGDSEIDNYLQGYIKVYTGYATSVVRKVN
jgi:predicted polyphosphate/ATP-dependent NAD kinase